MPVWTRMKFVLAALTSCAVVGLIYATAGQELIAMGTGSGAMTGPFSTQIKQVDNLIPPLLGALMLGSVVYLVYGSAREERRVGQRPPRRRP